MAKAFVCNKYKSLRIRDMQFVGGLYVAKNKSEEKAIQTAHGYGVWIFPQDEEPETEESTALAAVNAALAEPQVHQGRVGTK